MHLDEMSTMGPRARPYAFSVRSYWKKLCDLSDLVWLWRMSLKPGRTQATSKGLACEDQDMISVIYYENEAERTRNITKHDPGAKHELENDVKTRAAESEV